MTITGPGSVCVVIPMKDPSAAKTRLGDTLPQKARAALCRTLFRQTLRVLQSVKADLHIVVVTASDEIRQMARSFGAAHVADPGDGLNAAVRAGADYAANKGFSTLCVLPGDLADPSVHDLEALFSHVRQHAGVVIAPSHDGGTNALLVSPPHAIGFAYGPGSSLAHQTAADGAGLSCVVMPLPSLLHDVDRASDLGARLTRGLDRSLGAFGT